jgi:hypothetical protein
VPVRVNFHWGTVDSYACNVSYSGLLVQCPGELPKSGERCDLVADLPLGTLKARGHVTRLDPDGSRFAIELTHIGKNGLLLLSALLAHLGTNNSLPPLGRL